jgi:hypothetical protein
MGEVEQYANDLMVKHMKGEPATGLVVSRAKESAIVTCEVLIAETGRTFFYRVKENLEGLTNIK